MIEKLVELNPIPVPPSMVKEQHQMMLYEMLQMMQMMGQGFDPQMFEGAQERAERRVRAGLILSAVARLEKIDVPDSEVDARFQKLAEESGKNIAKVRAEHQGEKRERLISSLLQEKLMDFLRQKATIKDGPAPASEAKATEEG
jgi:trigger factor